VTGPEHDDEDRAIDRYVSDDDADRLNEQSDDLARELGFDVDDS
jgi:hypothetical protein